MAEAALFEFCGLLQGVGMIPPVIMLMGLTALVMNMPRGVVQHLALHPSSQVQKPPNSPWGPPQSRLARLPHRRQADLRRRGACQQADEQ